MTRMERKRKKQMVLINTLAILFTLIALLLATEVCSEVRETFDMMENASATTKASEAVLEDAREALVVLEAQKLEWLQNRVEGA